MNLQSFLNQLPASLSNHITNWVTRGVCISRWDNRLLGLSSFPIQTIFDIGANEGQSTQKLAKIFPDATIYAFEPVKSAFLKLKKYSEKNDKVIPYNYAIGDEEKKIIFNEYEGANQASSILSISSNTLEAYPVLKRVKQQLVQQKILDNLGLNLQGDCLIKIDVQGYEKQVIQGGYQTFKQSKCCIIEINNEKSYNNQCDFKTLFYLLDSLGFTYQGNIDQIYDQQGRVKYFDAVFVRL